MRRWGMIFLLWGCGTTYEPKKTGDIRKAVPPGFAPKGSISFVNAQTSKEEVKIGQSGSAFEPVTADLHAWTDVVIRYARDLVPAAAGISKSISMKVVGARQHQAQTAKIIVVSRASCEVDLEVATASGYQRAFHAESKAVLDEDSACEDATRDVTAQVFQDFQILKYLSE